MKIVALLGNPNVGKTTLFNSLTGANQRVGNWAGVTVDKKEGFFDDIKIVDLPGIYAMDTYSNEEKVSKNFLETDEVDVILNIVDASNIDRNLYLTTQLKQFNKPIILAVNMIDVAKRKGIYIDYNKLSELLNITVIPIIASKEEGIEDIKTTLKSDNFLINDADNDYQFKTEKEAYSFIEDILKKSSVTKSNNEESFKDKLDNFLLNPWLAYPIFIIIMALMFQITFAWVGQPLSDMLDGLLNDSLLPYISDLLSNTSPWFQSLIVDGIVAGVGGILVLLPIILALFTCISILEDSGYMARVAFIMDKLMRRMGLSGKAFIPMIVGFGCTVPAIMSARTLESEKDRKLTALLVPLMSCNARLPVYAIFASVFFPDYRVLVVAGLYLLGVILAFILGILFKNTIFKKDEEPFIIELPEYKRPSLKNISKQVYEKAKGFLIKAGTIIFAMSVVIWFLSNFNFTGMVDVNDSILASIGGFIAPIFRPLGFGDWQSSVSLLTGLLAKETVVASMEVIFAGDLSAMLPLYFNAASALSFLVFVLLYTPCISVLGAMKKEYGIKFTLLSVSYQLVLAWVVSFLIFNIGRIFI
ncbi:ferrous iron transport protein B [Clostridium chauvoei]|uniref:ferrous iron transport protein B n=1 Tax=Clostridium chauvoei TaxID=46867 RepID=UPI001C84B57A|nr:ferrous iron transport protein B [Clostridium chauvoei]MBX7370586.1 ferrous iron transport protein B [Clostridium chauvoei]MBX7372982.1 ferrous iron transport protein B [Clostridium chauvoei]MBX7385710.1 ferrous iron transport protein B [Clostridium chauvoei]MBX7420848.1 ferrous iron transport protein B [Clostridium chauvoei]